MKQKQGIMDMKPRSEEGVEKMYKWVIQTW